MESRLALVREDEVELREKPLASVRKARVEVPEMHLEWELGFLLPVEKEPEPARPVERAGVEPTDKTPKLSLGW